MEDLHCQIMIQTVSTDFNTHIEKSIDITVKTNATLSSDRYSEIMLTANNLVSQLSDVNKNLTSFYTALINL